MVGLLIIKVMTGPFTIMGEAKECEPLQFNVDSQADIQIGIINLIGRCKVCMKAVV